MLALEHRYQSIEQDMPRSSFDFYEESCCRCVYMWKVLKCFRGTTDTELSPESSPVPQPTSSAQYQAPVVDPPIQVASVPAYQEDRDAERGSLLPKGNRNSSPLMPLPFTADTGSRRSDAKSHRSSGSMSGLKGKGKSDEEGDVGTGSGGLLADLTDDEDEDVCPTCLEIYNDENPKMFLQCGHHFHYPCVLEWFQRKDTCPVCDSKVQMDDL